MILLGMTGEHRAISGEIRSLETFNYVNRPTPHVHILLETERGEILVDLGPKWYLKAQGIDLQAVKSVKIEGILRSIDGTRVLEAIQLNQGDKTYRFRSNTGAPLWSNARYQIKESK